MNDICLNSMGIGFCMGLLFMFLAAVLIDTRK